jgi:hypothetical protein
MVKSVDFEAALRDYQKKLTSELSKQYRAGVIQIFNAIIVASPRKSGRFAGNWIASIDTPIYTITDNTTSYDVGSYLPSVANINSTFYLTNNLPYAVRLAEGYSKQRSSGWIDAIILDGQYKLKEKLNSIRVGDKK